MSSKMKRIPKNSILLFFSDIFSIYARRYTLYAFLPKPEHFIRQTEHRPGHDDEQYHKNYYAHGL